MIQLREIERGDVEAIHRWRQDRGVTDTLVGAFRHVNVEADERWFERYQSSRDREVRLAVVLDDGDFVGVVYLLQIDWIARSAQLGLMIGERSQWGRGIGTEAVRLAVEHAFHDLNLHRLYLDVIEGHERAIGVYEKNGFVREGLARDAAFKEGRYVSLIHMGLLSNERGETR